MACRLIILVAAALAAGASGCAAQTQDELAPLVERCEELACSARPVCMTVPVVLADGSLDFRTVCARTPRR